MRCIVNLRPITNRRQLQGNESSQYDKRMYRHMAKHSIAFGLVICWLVVQLGLFGYFGVRHGGDSGRYLGAPQELFAGKIPHGKSASYLGYTAFVAVILALGLGESGIVGTQILISGLAAYYLYRLAEKMYGERAAQLAAFLFIIYLELTIWNIFILTDSLFISLPIIAMFTWIQKRYIIATLLTAWIVSLRPEGFVFAVAMATWLLYWLYQMRQWKWIGGLLLIGLALTPLAWQVGKQFIAQEELPHHYSIGAVIWNYPPMYLKTPANFIKLAASKLIIEIAHLRPYHDAARNLLIMIVLFPLYALAILGWRKPSKIPAAKWILTAWFILKMMVVMVTFADWTGRFLLHVLPVVILFAAAYAQHIRPKLA